MGAKSVAMASSHLDLGWVDPRRSPESYRVADFLMMISLVMLSLVAVAARPSPQELARPKLDVSRGALHQTLVFSVGGAVNGGLVGGFGPCLHAIAESTGLSQEALGRAVFLNRLAKLFGTVLSTAYLERVSRGAPAHITPQHLLASCLAAFAACAFTLSWARSSALALHVALIVCGLCYGATDNTFTQLALWRVRTAREQRYHVALLNAGFTTGAVVAPAVVAGSLRAGGSVYLCFHVLTALATLAAIALLASPHVGVSAAPVARPAQTRHEPESARARTVIGCMALVLMSVTGCEHTVATWLPTFGIRLGRVQPATMALMASSYWATICAGRLGWAALAALVPSGWPVLGLDGLTMLVAGVLYIAYAAGVRATALLWAATVLLALGFASSLPCAMTLPAEAGLAITPARLLALNLAGSVGEMLFPVFISLLFGRGRYGGFGFVVATLQLVVLSATGFAWATVRGQSLTSPRRPGAS